MASARTGSLRPQATRKSGPLFRSTVRRASAETRENAPRKSCLCSEPLPRRRSYGQQVLGRQCGRSAENTPDACDRALGSLGSDEFVDSGAQVLKHKILVCSGFAVIDL